MSIRILNRVVTEPSLQAVIKKYIVKSPVVIIESSYISSIPSRCSCPHLVCRVFRSFDARRSVWLADHRHRSALLLFYRFVLEHILFSLLLLSAILIAGKTV